MTSLRIRLVLSLLVVAIVSVGTATAVFLRDAAMRVEHDLAEAADRASRLTRADLDRLAERLDRELGRALDPRGPGAGLGRTGDAARRWGWAIERLDPGQVDVLEVLATDGEILSSGHWPASLGALDPSVQSLLQPAPRGLTLSHEAVATGSTLALVRWQPGRWGDRDVVGVAGRALDDAGLASLREMAGADLLAACGPDAPCLDSRSDDLAPLPARFTPHDGAWRSRLELREVTAGLWVGIDRSGLDALRRAIRLRALVVGALGMALAIALGLALSRRIAGPVEALADAAGSVARGEPLAIDGIPRTGIAEVERLVGAFRQMAEDLDRGQRQLIQAERVAAWREIARGLAHELKNPLTPIQASMDVIRRARRLDRPDFDAILDEQATAVVEEVQRLKELADSFARFARLPEASPEPLDLVALVDGALVLYAADPSIEIIRRLPSHVPLVPADRTQLQTAVTNLVKNAAEAIAEGADKGTHKLLIRVEVEPRDIRLTIEDSGPGVDPSIAARLFTPYVTTKGSRGTGLGLALVHRIAVEHGGSIEAGHSDELGGAAFTLVLPRAGR